MDGWMVGWMDDWMAGYAVVRRVTHDGSTQIVYVVLDITTTRPLSPLRLYYPTTLDAQNEEIFKITQFSSFI